MGFEGRGTSGRASLGCQLHRVEVTFVSTGFADLGKVSYFRYKLCFCVRGIEQKSGGEGICS